VHRGKKKLAIPAARIIIKEKDYKLSGENQMMNAMSCDPYDAHSASQNAERSAASVVRAAAALGQLRSPRALIAWLSRQDPDVEIVGTDVIETYLHDCGVDRAVTRRGRVQLFFADFAEPIEADLEPWARAVLRRMPARQTPVPALLARILSVCGGDDGMNQLDSRAAAS
jgi:hypothetical protein